MKILLIIKNEFTRSLTNKKKLLLMLLVPVVSVIFAMGINNIMKPSINIGIIDKESKNICESFKNEASQFNRIKVADTEESSIYTDMILAKYATIIQFNDDGNFIVSCLDPYLKTTIENVVTNFIYTGNINGLDEILSKMEKGNLTVSQRGIGFILLTLMITCTMMACNFIKDKENGILIRFRLSSKKLYVYILGIYFYNLIITIIQISISTLALKALSIDLEISLFQFFIIGLTVAVTASSFGVLMVSICNTELQASLMASSVAMLVSLFGGSLLPLEKMPSAIKAISNVTVTKWLIQLIYHIENKTTNVEYIIPIIAIFIISAITVGLVTILGRKKFVL